ncbi:hypothetical protein K9M41_01370 [Candidatus Gracilibacteria bacterium]|nr:hypothetical protein [Candidatus Gracilibacteria bacterium]
MPNKNKKNFLNEKVFPFGKGIVFGLGLLAIGLVVAQIDIDFADRESGGEVTARDFNRILGVLRGWRNDNGNIGIGIDPTEKLHIGGNFFITGSLTAQNLDAAGDVTITENLKGLNLGLCDEGQAMNGFSGGEVSCVDLPTGSPSVNLLVNGDSNGVTVDYNDQVTLTWTTFAVAEEGCFLDGGEFDFVAVETDDPDGVRTGNLEVDSQYTLYCAREGQPMMTDSVEVAVSNTPMPTVTLEVTGINPINSGQTSALSWSAENADTCYMSCYGSCTDEWISGLGNDISGINVQTDTLTQNTGYSMYCTGNGGMSTSVYTEVLVNQNLFDYVFVGNNDWGVELGDGGDPPTITNFSVDDEEVIEGGSTTLRWASDGDSCLIDDGQYSYEEAGTGSMSTGSLEDTTIYTIVCLNEDNTPPTGSDEEYVIVEVLPPRIQLSANPNPVNNWSWGNYNYAQADIQLYWEVRDMTSCYGDMGYLDLNEDGTGSGVVDIHYHHDGGNPMPEYIDYTVTCWGVEEQELSETLRVNMVPTLRLRAVLANAYEGGKPYLGWLAFGGTCNLSEDGDEFLQDVNHSYWSNVNDATPMTLGEHTYTLECSNNYGTVSETVTVTAVEAPIINDFAIEPISIYSGRQTTISWSTENAVANSCRAYLGGNAYEYNIGENEDGTNRSVYFDAFLRYKDFHLSCDGAAGGAVEAKVRLCNEQYDVSGCGEMCLGANCVPGQ